MSWGVELWDKFDDIVTHTDKGIALLEKYGNFVHDRTTIEREYAAKLKRLVKKYEPKKNVDGELEFSTWRAFVKMLRETTDLAGQRELVAESFEGQIVQGIDLLVRSLREDCKKHQKSGLKLRQDLNANLDALSRSKRGYEKNMRESEKALENFKKAEFDYNMSRADVDNYRRVMRRKVMTLDVVRQGYLEQLQRTNKLQRNHYENLMPAVLNQLQNLDEQRTRGMREFIVGAVDVESAVATIVANCLEGMRAAAVEIEEAEDVKMAIEKFQSGFQPPPDIPFSESLGKDKRKTRQIMVETDAESPPKPSKLMRMMTLGLFRHSRRPLQNPSINQLFRDLPPKQRRKKLQEKILEIEQKIEKTRATIGGLERLRTAYEQNTSLGNADMVEAQITDIQNKLKLYEIELGNYQECWRNVEKTTSAHGKYEIELKRTQSAEELSRRSSAIDINSWESIHEKKLSLSSITESKEKKAASADLIYQSCLVFTPASGTSETNTTVSQESRNVMAKQSTETDDSVENLQDRRLKCMDTCRALFNFEPTTEGTIRMRDDEEFQVMETDRGDGWTHVRRISKTNECMEGFVPTSYIEFVRSLDEEVKFRCSKLVTAGVDSDLKCDEMSVGCQRSQTKDLSLDEDILIAKASWRTFEVSIEAEEEVTTASNMHVVDGDEKVTVATISSSNGIDLFE